MKRFIRMLMFMLVAAAAGWAETALPPDLAALQQKVARAKAASAAVQAELEKTRTREKTYDTALRTLTYTQLRLADIPSGFWVVQSVLSNAPQTPGLVAATVHSNQKSLVRAQKKGARLATLYGKNQAKMQELEALTTAFANARGRLRAEERGMLTEAGIDADTLATQLEESISSTAETTEKEASATTGPTAEPPAPPQQAQGADKKRIWPVAGRLSQRFRGGKGATAEGVVLQGVKGSPVKSPVAGTVMYAGPFRVFGGLVIIKAEGDTYTLLGGLQTLHVNLGNEVVPGQVIGELAESGKLYWEARNGKRVVNPLSLR